MSTGPRRNPRPDSLPGFVTQVAVFVAREALRARRRRRWLAFLAPADLPEISAPVASDEDRSAIAAFYAGDGRALAGSEVVELTCRPATVAAAEPAARPDPPAPASVTPPPLPLPLPLRLAPPSTAPSASPAPSAIAPVSAASDAREPAAPAAAGNDPAAIGAVSLDRQLDESAAVDLMSLAVASRRAGRTEVAERAYRAVRSRFAGSDQAAQATFLLARMLADLGRVEEGERWFVEYAMVAPAGTFAEESSGRLLAIAIARHDEGTARARARTYLERFPRGPSAELARAHLGP